MKKYANLKGPAKKQYLDNWNDLRLTNGKATATKEESHSREDIAVGRCLGYWKIAEEEGGLLDKESGMYAADNWVDMCEKKEAPLTMYDRGTETLKYMYMQLVVNENLT